jgi:propanediol dehydratase small subunit
MFEDTAKFVKCANNISLDEINLESLEWNKVNNSEMQLIDLQGISIWWKSSLL